MEILPQLPRGWTFVTLYNICIRFFGIPFRMREECVPMRMEGALAYVQICPQEDGPNYLAITSA